MILSLNAPLKRAITWLAACCMCLAVLGCQHSRKALDLESLATIHLYTSEDVNPDADNRPSPVVLRIYKLTDDRRFKRSDFLSLYEGAENRLGDNFLGEVTLKELAPGETRQEVIKLPDTATHIGVLAEFSQYNQARATVALPIVPHSNNVFHIHLSKAAIEHVEK